MSQISPAGKFYFQNSIRWRTIIWILKKQKIDRAKNYYSSYLFIERIIKIIIYYELYSSTLHNNNKE